MKAAILYIYIYMYTYIYIYVYLHTPTSLYNVALLNSVDVVPLMKTTGVVENYGHCT